jgi:thymidylate kinase
MPIGTGSASPHLERAEPQRATQQSGLARAVLTGLDEADVRWCLLRGDSACSTTTGDVDVLVAAADLNRAIDVIEAHGLIRLRAFGRATHVFFVGLEPATSSWLELDLVTELAYGRTFEVRMAAAGECLARRRRHNGMWTLTPEDEYWALLLHCLLDKHAFPDHHLRRLKDLAEAASLDSPLARAMPPKAAPSTLLRYAQQGRWSALMARRRAVLAACRRADPVTATRRFIGSAAQRVVERPLQAWSRRGISVALLGPDGAGKSTLAGGIASAFYFPVWRVYMGLWQADQARQGMVAQGLRILLRPMVVWRRYLASVRHRAFGRTVVFDRYVYDALLPPRGSLVWLKRPYFRLLSRSCPAPDLVLLLDAPGNVLHARSGEYDAEHLEAERAYYRLLEARIPRLERIDAHRPPDRVLADALACIWQQYRERAAR